MASNKESTSQTLVTWNQKITDFTVVLQSGKRVRVSKYILAENSEVFESMLTQEYEEAKNNEMSLAHFKDETVVRFIEYLYSDRRDPEIIAQVRAGIGPNEYIYKRRFAREKLTMDMLEIAHMYQVEDLKKDCSEYLLKNISDDNVMEVWLGAQAMEYESLASTAIKHLAERPKGKSLKDVPRLVEAFQSNDKSVYRLLDFLTDKNSSVEEENNQLKAKVKLFEEVGMIKITVERRPWGATEWTEEFYVRSSDMVSTIIEKLRSRRENHYPSFKWGLAKSNVVVDEFLDSNKSFQSNGILTNCLLIAWQFCRN